MTPLKYLLFALVACSALPAFAQTPAMVSIPSGKFTMGNGYQYEIKGFSMYYIGTDEWYEGLQQKGLPMGEIPSLNGVQKQVFVDGFQLSSTEVSNREYKFFLLDSLLGPEKRKAFEKEEKRSHKKDSKSVGALWGPVFALALERGLMPDTACWENDFTYAYNGPLRDNYFQHPAFDDYPVVGVTWSQANAYCDWLSRFVRAESGGKEADTPSKFRLPTEAEWEYAALGRPGTQRHSEIGRDLVQLYPWPGKRVRNEKGNWRANVKADHSDYSGDGFEYTAPVSSFQPNNFGLYNMAGNAAEWVGDAWKIEGTEPAAPAPNLTSEEIQAEVRVAKGGSWAEYRYAAMCGSRTGFPAEKGHSRVGFRVARDQ